MIRVKDIPYLKGYTQRKNPTILYEDLIIVRKECLKLHKYVFLTMDILFVDKIPFLITLSQKIDLTAEIQFSTHKAIDIFKSFL